MNLASIQRIHEITPIDGSDAIETAHVLGWQVVIKKGEYSIGDLCTYIQIDTVVPDSPEFSFLAARNFRVRTIKLRKQISQGLIIPLPVGSWKEGDDVTEIIGIKKYEKPGNNPGDQKPRIPKIWYKKYWWLFKHRVVFRLFPGLEPKFKSPFPSHLVFKTDETRIQNIPRVLHSHKGKVFSVSYKLDGSSITIIHEKKWYGSKFRICSRNFELHGNGNEWTKTFNDTGFKKQILKLVEHFKTDEIIVQGEMIGRPNGNHHDLENNEIRLFNIFVRGKKIDPATFYSVCRKMDIPRCPNFGLIELDHSMEEILKISQTKDPLNPKVACEGMVWRSIDGDLSFKAINNDYLLKHEK